jgi:hypothetical protein
MLLLQLHQDSFVFDVVQGAEQFQTCSSIWLSLATCRSEKFSAGVRHAAEFDDFLVESGPAEDALPPA